MYGEQSFDTHFPESDGGPPRFPNTGNIVFSERTVNIWNRLYYEYTEVTAAVDYLGWGHLGCSHCLRGEWRGAAAVIHWLYEFKQNIRFQGVLD